MAAHACVTVEPWAHYSDSGGPPAWRVRIAAGKLDFAAFWSTRYGRFVDSWSIMNLRRSNPAAHGEAVKFMHEFCAKVAHQPPQATVTERRATVTENDQSVTRGTVTGLARAQEPSGWCHGVTPRDVTTENVTAKRDSAPLRSDTVTLGNAEADRKEKTAEHRARLAADPRFAGWTGLEDF